MSTTSHPASASAPSVAGRRRAARTGTLMGVASMSTVQLGSALTVPMFARLGVLGTAGMRLAWAGIVLLVLVRPRRRDFEGRDFTACVGLGVVTAGLMVFFALAISRLPLGTASALEFLGPLAVSLFGPGHGRRVWTVAAGLGVVLLTEPWHGGVDPVGLAFALAAACCWAAYILLTQHVGDRVTGLSGLAVSMPVAAVVALLVAAPTLGGRLSWGPALIMLGLAVLSPLVPFALEFQALRRLTASSFGTLMSLEPAIALAIGILVLQQTPGAGPALGVALVVTAGVGATRSGARPEPVQPPHPAAPETAAPSVPGKPSAWEAADCAA
ncbi:EamA family transporter [Streptacidiphilus neutrinimicus]|uniref:EamA family transporter n=1 Tax=Streptacidiphilus neutrinimicus TaxID=105420 RepID=UPI001EEE2B27|nr:EamA family transporter [Streptacidiphilus neutrinimicus]